MDKWKAHRLARDAWDEWFWDILDSPSDEGMILIAPMTLLRFSVVRNGRSAFGDPTFRIIVRADTRHLNTNRFGRAFVRDVLYNARTPDLLRELATNWIAKCIVALTR